MWCEESVTESQICGSLAHKFEGILQTGSKGLKGGGGCDGGLKDQPQRSHEWGFLLDDAKPA